MKSLAVDSWSASSLPLLGTSPLRTSLLLYPWTQAPLSLTPSSSQCRFFSSRTPCSPVFISRVFWSLCLSGLSSGLTDRLQRCGVVSQCDTTLPDSFSFFLTRFPPGRHSYDPTLARLRDHCHLALCREHLPPTCQGAVILPTVLCHLALCG